MEIIEEKNEIDEFCPICKKKLRISKDIHDNNYKEEVAECTNCGYTESLVI